MKAGQRHAPYRISRNRHAPCHPSTLTQRAQEALLRYIASGLSSEADAGITELLVRNRQRPDYVDEDDASKGVTGG